MENLEKIIESERVQSGKSIVLKSYGNYLKNREKALKGINVEKLKEKLKKIKKNSISNLDELKKKTISSLKLQNIQVFEAKDAKEARVIALKLIPKRIPIVLQVRICWLQPSPMLSHCPVHC